MNQPDLGTGQPDQVMWKLAPLIVLTFGMITLASACGGEGQEVRPAPTATTPPTEVPTPTPSAAATDRIAFKSLRDGDWEIYVMNGDGSGQTRLTNNPGEDGFPDWSPDGSRIALDRERDGQSEICVMNADGTDPRYLTNDAAQDWDPASWATTRSTS